MPGPLRWLFDAAKKVYHAMRGERREASVRIDPRLRESFQAAARERGLMAGLVDDLFSEKATLQQWTLDFRENLKQAYIAQYLVARGGRENMTQEDWGRLGGLLRNQYQYLNGFAQDLADGKLSQAQARIRAGMYLDSARQSFERGKMVGAGIPNLPAYPCDGSAECRTNDRCSWRIEETEGGWNCFWVLDPQAEHCDTCLERAGSWNPLFVARPF